MYGEGRGVYRVLVGKHEGKRPLGRPRRRWEDNIKMDLRKWDVRIWTGLSCLRIGTGECGSEASGSIKCGEFLNYLQAVSFSRRTMLHGVSKLVSKYQVDCTLLR
jgi:hypothetical protein